MRRATPAGSDQRHSTDNFYPRSPCGERQRSGRPKAPARDFYPRSPCGERLWLLFKFKLKEVFLSTLSLRRATIPLRSRLKRAIISIHALLAESDGLYQYDNTIFDISIHALLAESDEFSHFFPYCWTDFYPRSPCGERREYYAISICQKIISIHALLAESDLIPHQQKRRNRISIHALLAESDMSFIVCTSLSGAFLSTLSLRRATSFEMHDVRWFFYFYPRSPCGERL